MKTDICKCGHLRSEHQRAVYPGHKNTKTMYAVVDKRKKPKVYFECQVFLCGCENFKE
jgi:hypothetical protein